MVKKKDEKTTKKTPAKKVIKKSTNTKKEITLNEKVKKTSTLNSKKFLSVGIIVVIIIAIIVAIVVCSKKSPFSNVERVESVQELNDRLNVKMIDPVDADNVKHGIENGNIARVEYDKKVSTGDTMHFIMRSSSSMEENMSGLTNEWGTPILMTVICDDGSEIQVVSYVATDDSLTMKGDWYDNDKYYSMITNNLATREDFLQEINRVIIANHITF